MSELEIYTQHGGLVGQPATRRASRAVGQVHGRAMVRSAGVQAEAEVTTDKIEAVGGVVRSAQLQAALTRQAAKNMELLAPEASAEIAQLAETGALLMSEVLIQGARRIARF